MQRDKNNNILSFPTGMEFGWPLMPAAAGDVYNTLILDAAA